MWLLMSIWKECVYSGYGVVQIWIKLAWLREAHCGAWGGTGLTEEELEKTLWGERFLCFDYMDFIIINFDRDDLKQISFQLLPYFLVNHDPKHSRSAAHTYCF